MKAVGAAAMAVGVVAARPAPVAALPLAGALIWMTKSRSDHALRIKGKRALDAGRAFSYIITRNRM